MDSSMTVRAGKKAFARIRERGFSLDDAAVIAGAAGGPKWLILSGLDRELCSALAGKRKYPLFLIGSSIGSWRFAAYAQKNPAGAMNRFLEIYLGQGYSEKPDSAEISRETERMMDEFLTDQGILSVLSHPFMRLQFFAVRSRGFIQSDKKLLLLGGLLLAASANLVSRGFVRLFFRQTLFQDGRHDPPFMLDAATDTVTLTPDNFRNALMASASIPLVMKGVSGIQGSLPGVYRDGGMVDYHLDLPYSTNGDSVVFYPHYTDAVIPGWFDKPYPWRRADRRNMENVLIVSPSKSMIERLPLKKIPDRNDFVLFKGHDRDRIVYWKTVADESRRMGDEFMELLVKNRIHEVMKEL